MTLTQTPSILQTKTQHPTGRRRRRPPQPPYRTGESRTAVRGLRSDHALSDPALANLVVATGGALVRRES